MLFFPLLIDDRIVENIEWLMVNPKFNNCPSFQYASDSISTQQYYLYRGKGKGGKRLEPGGPSFFETNSRIVYSTPVNTEEW